MSWPTRCDDEMASRMAFEAHPVTKERCPRDSSRSRVTRPDPRASRGCDSGRPRPGEKVQRPSSFSPDLSVVHTPSGGVLVIMVALIGADDSVTRWVDANGRWITLIMILVFGGLIWYRRSHQNQ